ncbi:MAG: hydrogenase maturation protease [Acidobacteriota bacterium]
MSGERQSSSLAVVLGMGNLILSDDGLGVQALHLLEQDPRVPAGASLVDAGTFGVELLGYVAGARRLLVLDAVDVGAAPGTLIRMEGEALSRLPAAGNAHDVSLADLLLALRLMGQEPGSVVLIGIQPARIEPGTELSQPVRAALAKLVDAAVRELAADGECPGR